MKKNKTLPKNYQELLHKGDVEELKKVFDKCELTACERGNLKCSALHFYDVPYEFMKWVLDQGYDPNTMSAHSVPLCYNFSDIENLKLLIEYGADVNHKCSWDATPFHYLCDWFSTALKPDVSRKIETFNLFLQNGADINARNKSNETPLLYILRRERVPETDFVKMVEILLEEHAKNKGSSLTEKSAGKNQHPIPDEDWLIAQKEIKRIGESHEFYKMEIIDEDFRNERSANMKRLYEIFDVEPVPERVMVTENSTIKVTSDKWQEQYEELWNMLVPGNGRAEFLQGEAIRLLGKLSYEVLEMGCCNWNTDFAKLPKAFRLIISYGSQLKKEDYDEALSILENIKNIAEDEFAFLSQKTVEWILKNPKPVKLCDFKNDEYTKLNYRR